MTRPNWGFRSDTQGQRTRFIIGGMVVLALGGLGAAAGLVVMQTAFLAGVILSVAAYAAIGLGVGASGTSLLALLATATAPNRRAAAATITWLMMIFGIAATAGIVGALLDPYSPALLIRIVSMVAVIAVVLTAIAVWGIERKVTARLEPEALSFRDGLSQVWADDGARAFTVFVFLSMTAYFMQELILEPFAGLVFGLTPGQTTALSGMQNGGVFVGMLLVGVAATGLNLGSLRTWVVAGCLGSCAALSAICIIGRTGLGDLLSPAVIALGFFNGMFAVAAIGSMMALASQGHDRREGTRMGLWGAAQAIAAGFGGLMGAALADGFRLFVNDADAFGAVFALEAALFVAAALLAMRVMASPSPLPIAVPGE
jgi:BCD family chlorophyll transporter-like MFS transporter